MRQYITAIVVSLALTGALCLAYASEQQGHADYVQAVRGSHQ